MAAEEVKADEAPDSPAPWELAVQIAGAAAGFAAFIYLIGAITVWVRLTTAHFPADVALDFMSKTAIAAVGFKGIVIILLILLPVFTLAFWYRGGHIDYPAWSKRWWAWAAVVVVLAGVLGPTYRIGGWKTPVMLGSLLLVALVVGITVNRAASPSAKKDRWTFIPITIAIVLAALVSWRGLAVTLSLLAFTWLAAIFIKRRATMTRYLRRWLIAGVVAIVGLAGLVWQVQAPVPISAVEIVPPVTGELAGERIPYFGETDSFVYVGEVTGETKSSTGEVKFRYTYNILEVPRSEITLLKFGQSIELRPDVDSPAGLIRHWFARVSDRIQGKAAG